MAVRVNANTDDILYTAGTIGENAFTAMMWYYVAVDRNDFSNIFWIGDDVYAEDGVCDLFLDGDGVSISCGIRNYNSPQVSLAEALVVGNWYHLCVSGSTATSQPFDLRVYRLSNNTQNTYSGTSGTLGTWPAGAAGKIQLMMTSAGSGAVWSNGRCQGFKIWNGVTLTADQIAWERWFVNPVFEQSNCYAAWPLLFDTDTRDLSGNGRSPTLAGLTVEDGPPLMLASGGKRFISRANPAGGGGTINTQTLTSNLITADEAMWFIMRNRMLESTPVVSDQTVALLEFNRRVEDTITITEGATIQSTIYNMLATDEITVIDELLRWAHFHRLLQDDVVITDGVITSIIGYLIFTSVLTSNVAVADQLQAFTLFNRLLDSNALTTDQALSVLSYTRDLLDGVDVFDDSHSYLHRFILLTDALSVNDSLLSLVTTPTTDSPIIRIGFDQPRIDIGGYGVN